jgi:MFS family permease
MHGSGGGLALLGTAFFMVILDSTIVLTAVPSMQAELGTSVAVVQWVLTGYAIAFGGLMLLGGRVADLLGRRRVFVAGLALFAVSSLVCGISWSAGILIAARVVQGLAAAVLAPTALSLLPAMVIFGPGLGAAFVACQIAALTDVPEQASGLAAGVVDTSFHLGNAIGIAIATSVAVVSTASVYRADPGADPLVALREGFRSAFGVTVGSAAVALLAALLLLRPNRRALPTTQAQH